MADGRFSVADSTDWLDTGLNGLVPVEAALRCHVCKDFFKTPMMTTCGHTFCSLCIRRALASDGKCPSCRGSEQELKLRCNLSLGEVVDAFTKARANMLDFATGIVGSGTDKERRLPTRRNLKRDSPQEPSLSPGPKRLRSSARLNRSEDNPSTCRAQSETEPETGANDDTSDGEYHDEPDDGLTPCPICGQRMKDWQVFSHLDKCTDQPRRRKTATEGTSENSESSFAANTRAQALDRLPALHYSMLKDQALRKKLSELGISQAGPRALLERRHREWVTIWNANCDGTRPKRRGELLQDLDLWERTQGGRAPVVLRPPANGTMVRDKEFDGAAWAAKHNTSFKDLIAKAKQSRQAASQTVKTSHQADNGNMSTLEKMPMAASGNDGGRSTLAETSFGVEQDHSM